jgi:hypothetical protein
VDAETLRLAKLEKKNKKLSERPKGFNPQEGSKVITA